MIENGFYKIKHEYADLINKIGGVYTDTKERPIFCCVEDKYISDLYWAIPTSDLSHRTNAQINKIKMYCNLDSKDIRWAYYHLGHTNRPAVYRISNCFPIIKEYIDNEYISNGKHLILGSEKDILLIRKKLSRILLAERKHPNKFEQHITDIKNELVKQLQQNI